jgi:hypothetical protein
MDPKARNAEPLHTPDGLRPSGPDRTSSDLDDDDPGPPHWNAPANTTSEPPGIAAEDWDDEVTQPSGVAWARQKPDGQDTVPHPAAAVEAVANLNELLRGELSAVETYQLALAAINDLEVARVLRQLRDQHEQRVLKLRDRIRQHGGDPVGGSGAWGLFAKLVQRGADLLGDRAAAAALEEGEDHGVRAYARHAEDFQPEVRDFVTRELLPAQRASHDLCRTLQQFVKAA